MDGLGIRSKQYGFKSNTHHEGAGSVATSTSLGKHNGMKASGNKQPPKLLSSPLWVNTTEACFRVLVQEFTSLHVDMYKYNGVAVPIDIDADDSSGGSLVEQHHQAGALLLPSPVSTPSLDATSGSAAGTTHISSVPAYNNDNDSLAPQLIDNGYFTFSLLMFL